MNAFNRAVIILLDLAMLAASCWAGAVAISPGLRAGAVERYPVAARFLELVPGRAPERWGFAALAGLLVVLGVLLLYMELRPERGEERLLLREDAAGEVAVLMDSVRRLADYVAGQLPNVREVQTRVVPTARGLRVRCRLAVDPAASVPELSREVQAKVGAAVEQHLGRPAERISVLAQITPITQSRRRVR